MFGRKYNISFLIVGTISAMIIILYFFRFGSNGLSSNLEEWGQAGDYFGGFLNPIVAILNLLVAIFIAKEVYSLTVSQGERQTIVQKAILKRQIQYDILKQFNFDFEKQIQLTESTLDSNQVVSYEKIISAIDNLDMVMHSFSNGGVNVFSSLGDEKGTQLWVTVRTLITEWKKRDNLINTKYSLKVRSYHALMIGKMYNEILE